MRIAFVILLLASSFPCLGQTNVLMYHNDPFHTGQNLSEKILTPFNVNPGRFGKLFVLAADGKVEGQPLYVAGLNMPDLGVHNVVFAVSEHDSVYAYDADQPGAPLWQISTISSDETPADTQGCSQVEPEVGITATPVIDLAAGRHGTIYLVSMSKDSLGNYHQRLHALDITDGQEEFGGPVEIAATFPGNGDASIGGTLYFNPRMYKERAALVLSNGVVYTSWASHCDIRPYTGWVIGFDQYTLSQTLAFNFTPDGEGGTIWGAGAGPAVDAEGRLYFQLANGTFDPDLDVLGFPYHGNFGNAFVKLSVDGRVPSVIDYWTMHDSVVESDADADLGSGGIMILPDVVDNDGTVHHLGAGAGKDGNIYVFDRDNMGKFDPNSNNAIYQVLPSALPSAELAAPAWFNGMVYFGAIDDRIRAYTMIGARLSTAPAAFTPKTFGYPGTTPSISADGNDNAILWALENSNPVVLHAYDAANIGIELYNTRMTDGRDDAGPGTKWIPPTIADGKVFVPTGTGVAVFGLLEQVNVDARPRPHPAGLVPD